MKPTKKIEATVLDVYNKWLHSYLNGDVATYNFYLDDAFHFIGSTGNEEFLNRKDTTNFFKVTAEQLSGKTQLRNETKIVEQFGELVFITHLFDAWFMNGNDWNFYGRFRFSNILEQNEAGWHFVYQHYSTPDSKAQEGETIGYDQISAENLQLREAIQRRTKELEEKNRELEIEGALQRIRAQAVAMKESTDLLDIVVTMRTEFTNLGHEAHYFWHMMWLPDTYEKAMTSGDGTKIGFVMELPRHIHGDIPLLTKWEKSKKPLIVYTMEAEDAIAYIDKMISLGDFQNIDPQAPSHDDVRHIGGLTFIMARTTHGEIGYSLPGVVENPPQEDLEILERFAGAFDLAHRRFLDLQKAEKQAREVEIELALEKVRSRTMAMRNSSELAEASALLDEQVRNLGIKTWGCAFHIYADNDEGDGEWFTSENGKLPFYKTPREKFFLDFYKKGQRGEKFHVQEFSGAKCKAHYEYLKSISVLGDSLRAMENSGLSLPDYQIDNIAFFKYGYILFITYEHVPEAYIIFQRFSKVFEQTYTRFLDLQKAEAQAREAQIEMALEKVRSRTMAMQHSDELPEAANLLFTEIQKLGIPAWSCGYNILSDDKKSSICIMSSEGEMQIPFVLPLTEHKSLKPWHKAIKNNKKFFFHGQDGKDLVEHYNYMKSLPGLKETFKQFEDAGLQLPTQQFNHLVRFNEGFLLFITYEEVPEAHDIFQRFGKVFEQTYTRFLDLQRAEAQAREAQIEASLERVRSKTMAMHSSEDVDITVLTLFEEVSKLGLDKSIRCGIGILQDREYMETWSATSTLNGKVDLKVGDLDMTLHPLLVEIKKTWQNGKKTLSYELEGKEVEEYYTVLNRAPQYPFQVDLTKLPNKTYHNSFYFNAGVLFAFTDAPISKEAVSVLNRFSGVFGQTYTRFLDLQKAEAQTRESEIELALERVRARTMAMQSSEELADAAFVLFEQLRNLDGKLWGTGFGLCDENLDTDEFWFANENGVFPPVVIPNTTDPAHKEMYQGWCKKVDFLTLEKSGKALKQHYNYMLSIAEVRPFFQKILDEGLQFPEKQQWNAAYFSKGYLLIITLEPYADVEILKRFANVFEQTYTRFLDLQKAEAQAREAQIEVALEKVRSRTMAMQRSDELRETAVLMFDQIHSLGVQVMGCGFNIWDADQKEATAWMTGINRMQPPFKTSSSKDIFLNIYEAANRGESLFVKEQVGEELLEHYKYMASIPTFKEIMEKAPQEGNAVPTFQIVHCAFFTHGYLMFITLEHVFEAHNIFIRFASVFEQTYTRFLDLQKSEAQAREARIEAALERVRSRSMAMHSSDELKDVIQVIYDQFVQLNIHIEHAGFILDYKNNKDMHIWLADRHAVFPEVTLPYFDCAHWNSFNKAKKKGQQFFANQLGFEEKNKFYNDLFEYIPDLPDDTKKTYLKFDGLAISTVLLESIGLYIENFSGIPFTTEENAVLIRFGKVFQQTYTRFQDLQKAEAQTRDAQIEAALEKVRSRTMAMQKGEEVKDVVVLLYKELIALGVTNFASCGYVEINEETQLQSTWVTSPGGDSLGLFYLPMTGDVHFDARYKAWKKQQTVFHQTVAGIERKKHLEYAITTFNSKEAEEMVLNQFPDPTVFYCFNFSHGYLHVVAGSLLTEEEEALLARFTKVFEQTYARFLDLEKAEAQTREAQINLAVERVRAKALAMHKSEEIIELVAKLKNEVMSLDIPDVVAATIFLNEGDDKVRMWDLSSLEDEDNYAEVPFDITFKLKKSDPNLYIKRVWENPENYFVEIQEEKDLKRLMLWLREQRKNEIADEVEDFIEKIQLKRLYHSARKLNNGKLVIDQLNPPSDEMETILTKMGAAFDLAYKRFEDLKKAEAQAKEALIEAALERVRSRTLAMQKSEELAETSVIVFKQLLELGIAPTRLFIGIINDNATKVEAWATNEDGSKIAKHFTLEALKNKSIKKMITGWKQQKKSIVLDMKGKELQEYFHYLNKDMKIPFINGLKQKRRVQTIAYFSGGLIGMVAPEEQPENSIRLLERFAAVFNLTYTRFKDLKIAEANAEKAEQDLIKLQAAKKSAEEALTELQLTQNQLIQAEKMASLGELTAGIAHEIQNPLNFVNNFSEVSNELIDEMNEELDKGDLEEAKAISLDIKQNLEKINHHGKRADNIVKGMLQHSRSSSGTKEPTDINVLADEYLRLAYHGLRAKDKSFNATLETDFDESIGTINVLPQDMGRVILNLITNAFYASNERKQASKDEVFKPTVSVSTKKLKSTIEISVKDNGNGIPKEIVDKIFQPFFTTKPTGQGTGLGLSLSYDIVKAHSGEIGVESEQGEGTTFIISLPFKINQ